MISLILFPMRSFSLPVVAILFFLAQNVSMAQETDLAASGASLTSQAQYISFRITKPDGSEYSRYDIIQKTEQLDKNDFVLKNFNVTEDLACVPKPSLESKQVVLPDQRTFLTSGTSMGVPVKGIVHFEDQSDGKKKISVEDHLANWWSLKGDGIMNQDSTQILHLELRNKSDELVLNYDSTSRPATAAEIKKYARQTKKFSNESVRSEACRQIDRRNQRFSYDFKD